MNPSSNLTQAPQTDSMCSLAPPDIKTETSVQIRSGADKVKALFNLCLQLDTSFLSPTREREIACLEQGVTKLHEQLGLIPFPSILAYVRCYASSPNDLIPSKIQSYKIELTNFRNNFFNFLDALASRAQINGKFDTRLLKTVLCLVRIGLFTRIDIGEIRVIVCPFRKNLNDRFADKFVLDIDAGGTTCAQGLGPDKYASLSQVVVPEFLSLVQSRYENKWTWRTIELQSDGLLRSTPEERAKELQEIPKKISHARQVIQEQYQKIWQILRPSPVLTLEPILKDDIHRFFKPSTVFRSKV